MHRWWSSLLSGGLRRLLALLGAVGVLGSAAPALAAPLPERSALDSRVAEVRRHLQEASAREDASSSVVRTLLAQSRWNNWPNWSNWANWRNG